MPSLAQAGAITGRGSPVRLEDLNRARLPSLYAARARAIEEESIAQNLRLGQEQLALRRREAELAAKRDNMALLTQGAGTVIQGAGLLEVARPGTLSGIGEALGLSGPSTPTTATPTAGATPLASPAVSAGAGLAAGAALNPALASAFNTGVAPVAGSVGAFPGTAGLVSPAGLPLSASIAPPAASGAATASGIGGLAASGTEAAAATAAAPAATAGLSGLAAGAAGGAAGLAGGFLGKAVGAKLLPFGGETGEKVEQGLVGAGAGAGVGFLVGGPVGAVVGGIVGGLTGGASVIATACYGIEAPETKVALRYRRLFVGPSEYAGYRKIGDPIVGLIKDHDWAKCLVRKVIVDPMLPVAKWEIYREQVGTPWEHYQSEEHKPALWRRLYVHGFRALCRRAGRRETRKRRRELRLRIVGR